MLMETVSRPKRNVASSDASSPVGTRAIETATGWSTESEYQRDIVEFLAHCWQRDVRAIDELTSCKRLSELIVVQSKWSWEAEQDHRTMLGKILLYPWKILFRPG
jgi:hypothetical protein